MSSLSLRWTNDEFWSRFEELDVAYFENGGTFLLAVSQCWRRIGSRMPVGSRSKYIVRKNSGMHMEYIRSKDLVKARVALWEGE